MTTPLQHTSLGELGYSPLAATSLGELGINVGIIIPVQGRDRNIETYPGKDISAELRNKTLISGQVFGAVQTNKKKGGVVSENIKTASVIAKQTLIDANPKPGISVVNKSKSVTAQTKTKLITTQTKLRTLH